MTEQEFQNLSEGDVVIVDGDPGTVEYLTEQGAGVYFPVAEMTLKYDYPKMEAPEVSYADPRVGITASHHTPVPAAGFDFTSFEAKARQLDRNLIAQARALAAAKGISELRLVIASIPGHEGVTLASKDVYPYATGVMSETLRRLADLAERELDRNA